MSAVRFTTSWDDGHPLDLRVAELLAKHGFRGTFYVPRRNIEGRMVMTTSELRSLAQTFEIGGHTVDHVRLDRVPTAEAERQIVDSKLQLEDELGRQVTGFCYPGGVHTARIRELVRTAGYKYARTIANFAVQAPADVYQVPTTMQLFPHRRLTYVKNFVRGGNWGVRSRVFELSLRSASLLSLLEASLRRACADGGVFHLWGHSWELEERSLWSVLDRFLALASALVGRDGRVENARAYARS